eukprot:Seg8990.2 transcript_id=Seg8990.2/GoldUCD/mRNA.D3Y31 product="hypothetical protein" protein_id=Seg8990.2/GoldUCD/D3Y31
MIDVFSDPSVIQSPLTFTAINNYGIAEQGVGSGVTKEIYSLFRKDAYESLMVGESERVPFIRHDMNLSKWEAIGRILLKGYIDAGYWPLKMSYIFIAVFLFGENILTEDTMLSSFKKYLSQSEAKLVEGLINEGVDVQEEEVQDFLSVFECKRLATTGNIKSILIEIGHKELVQKPQYIAKCWQVTKSKLKSVIGTLESLYEIYEKIKPSTNRVTALLKTDTSSQAHLEIFGYLKRYIKGLDDATLAKFLRYCTGADVIICDEIVVTFTEYSGMGRRPIAHTCGCVLEIPATFANFVEFREEFGNILNCDNWEIDIT